MRTHRLMRTRHRESGRVAVMAPLAGVACLICVGIGVDFSGQVLAEQTLRDQAYSCARQGAHHIGTTLNPQASAATREARECMTDYGYAADAVVRNDLLTVTATSTYRTTVLTIIMIDELPITGQATVTLQIDP